LVTLGSLQWTCHAHWWHVLRAFYRKAVTVWLSRDEMVSGRDRAVSDDLDAKSMRANGVRRLISISVVDERHTRALSIRIIAGEGTSKPPVRTSRCYSDARIVGTRFGG
jgi:hypothetical protein